MADGRRFTHAGSGRPHQVTVKPGDIVVAGAISATQQNLAEGHQGVYHAFGGNRGSAGHPTHACPGADPATGRNAGFLQCTGGIAAAVACRSRSADFKSGRKVTGAPQDARPHPCTGDQNARAANDFRSLNSRSSPVGTLHDPHAYQIRDADRLLRATTIPLATFGNSWLFQFPPVIFRPSLTSSLRDLGYGVGNSHSLARPAHALSSWPAGAASTI